MALAGIKTVNISQASAVDEVVANRTQDGVRQSVRIPVAALGTQIAAGSGAIVAKQVKATFAQLDAIKGTMAEGDVGLVEFDPDVGLRGQYALESGVLVRKDDLVQTQAASSAAIAVAARDEAVAVAPSTWEALRDQTVLAKNDAAEEAVSAETDALIAGVHRVAAEDAAANATLVTGGYADTAAGLAATSDGDLFTVPAPDAADTLAVYENAGGSAVDTSRRIPAWGDAAKAAANASNFRDILATLPSISKVVLDGGLTSYLTASIDGGLKLETSASGYTMGLLSRLQVSDGPLVVEADFAFTTSFGTSARGVALAVGNGAERKWWRWISSGTIAQLDQDGSVDISFGATPASRVLAQGDTGMIGLAINEDRTGWLLLTLASGDLQAIFLDAIPEGPIYLGAIGQSGNVFTFTEMRWRGRNTSQGQGTALKSVDTDADPMLQMLGRGVRQQTSANIANFSAAADAGTMHLGWPLGTNYLGAVDTLLRDTNGPLTLRASFEIVADVASTYVTIAIGEGADIRWYTWTEAGSLVVQNNAAANVPALASSVGAIAFAQGDTITMEVEINADRTGKLRVIPASLDPYVYDLTDIPTGGVALGCRTGVGGKVDVLSFDWVGRATNLASRVALLENEAGLTDLTVLKSFAVLPDLNAGGTPAGFTCTGLDRLERGIYAGCFVVGCDGRLVEGDGSPYAPRLVILTPDLRLVESWDLPVLTSLQGVTRDGSGATDTVWAARASDKTIRHYEIYGVNAGVEIDADRLDWDALTYPGDPNGVAWSSKDGGSLWVCCDGDTDLRRISIDDGSLLETLTGSAAMDHLHYDETNELLYFSEGANGSPGSIYVFDLIAATPYQTAHGPLVRAEAVEGFYPDRLARQMLVMSDGGFHDAAEPALNIGLWYSIVPFEPAA